MKFLVEVDRSILPNKNIQPRSGVYCTDSLEFDIISENGLWFGEVPNRQCVRYSDPQKAKEVYKQFKLWASEIYKCSINKYYLKIFADMGGDIIFRFPEE